MTTTEAIAEELYQFLEKKNVKDVFGHITEQMLMYKPNNVVRFIVKTLKNDFPDEASALEEGEIKIHETFQLFGEGECGDGAEQEYDDGTVKRSANSGAFETEAISLGNHDQSLRVHISEGNSKTMDKLVDEQVRRNFEHVFGQKHTKAKSQKVGEESVIETSDAQSEQKEGDPAAVAPPANGGANTEGNGDDGGDDDDDDELATDAEILAQFGHLFPILEKHALFASMETWEWLQVCRNLEEVHSRKHDMVCKMGEGGPEQDYFYIIENGDVEVFVMQVVKTGAEEELSPQEKEAQERERLRKANLKAMGLEDDVGVNKKKDAEAELREEIRRKKAKEKGKQKRAKKVLANYSRGDTFGELALLYAGRREASVLVTSPKAKFWRLSRTAFKTLSFGFLQERSRRRQALINKIKIFSPLTAAEKALLADALEVETFRKDDVLIQQGAEHQKIFIISEGVVSLSQRNRVGRQVELCQVSPGNAFAEHALITSRPSQMSAIALSQTVQCYTLTKSSFIQSFGAMTTILQRSPELNSELMSILI